MTVLFLQYIKDIGAEVEILKCQTKNTQTQPKLLKNQLLKQTKISLKMHRGSVASVWY